VCACLGQVINVSRLTSFDPQYSMAGNERRRACSPAACVQPSFQADEKSDHRIEHDDVSIETSKRHVRHGSKNQANNSTSICEKVGFLMLWHDPSS
jgi:hypothetical protein